MRKGTLAALALPVLMMACGTANAAELVSFTFAPKEGTEVAYTRAETHRYDIPGKKSMSRTLAAQTLLVEKVDRSDTRVRVTIDELRQEEDGVHKPVPGLDSLTKKRFWLTADKKGAISKMEGLSELSQGVRESFPNPRIRDVMAVLFTEEKLKERFTAEWNARVAPMAGRTAAVGESWYDTREVYMPFLGTVVLYQKTTLTGIKKIKGRQVAHLVHTWFSDPVTLPEKDRPLFEKARQSLGDVPSLARQGIGVSGQGEGWVEPKTMIIHNEKQHLRGVFAGVSKGTVGGVPDAAAVELSWEIAGTVK